MPMMTKENRVRKSELPSTLARSSKKAQRTFAKAHDAAVKEYGEGERAMRTAWSALKHTHEKVGNKWQRKDKNGPSDEQAKGGRKTKRKPADGVNANATKAHLYEVATKLKIKGRSSMSKPELVKAIRKENDRRKAADVAQSDVRSDQGARTPLGSLLGIPESHAGTTPG